MKTERLNRVLAKLEAKGIHQMIITDPVSILKKAGVDLTTKTPFETAMKEFADTLSEFEKC